MRVSQSEADYEAAQQDLIIRVATRYFDVLAAEDVLTSINADRTAIARQLEQARQRFEVGLIAITDVQESQAAYDQSRRFRNWRKALAGYGAGTAARNYRRVRVRAVGAARGITA